MPNISGVVQILEGSDAQVTPIQYNREIVWVSDKKAFKYLDCSGVSHYVYESGVLEHGALEHLSYNDHPQYSLRNGSLPFTGTVSGVTPTENSHLSTKAYVDGTLVTDHGGFTGLGDNDHVIYITRDGAGAFTGTVSGVTPIDDAHLATKGYIDGQIVATSPSGLAEHLASGDIHFYVEAVDHTRILNVGTTHHNVIDNHIASGDIHYYPQAIVHNVLQGLSNNDHPHYVSKDGLGAFTGTVSGIYPTEDEHLVTKAYVDTMSGVSAHGDLTGLAADDHTQYLPVDASRHITGPLQVDNTVAVSGSASYSDYTGFDVNNSGSFIPLWYFSATSSGVTDHTQLTTIGTNTHDSIDNHIEDSTIHFTQGSIDHGAITGLLDNDHPQYITKDGLGALTGTLSGITPTEDEHLSTKEYVDTAVSAVSSSGVSDHIASGDIHFYQEAVDHTRLQNIGTNPHTTIDSHIASGDIHYFVDSIPHTAIQNIGTNSHSTIDDHLASGDVHFYEVSIDHESIQNIGSNGHITIDSHMASGDLHYYQDAIDHGSIQGISDNDHTQYISKDGLGAFTGTVSGITPVEDAHLTTKEYVDDLTSSGGVSVHAGLTGLDADDHTQYMPVNASRDFTNDLTVDAGLTVSGAAGYQDWQGLDLNNSGSFVPLWYFSASASGVTDHTQLTSIGTNSHGTIDSHISASSIHFTEGSIDHGSIAGLTDNDHVQYTTKDGLGAFTGTVSGIMPVHDSHLSTKEYVDDVAYQIPSISGELYDHTASGDIHYFQETVDHTIILNRGTVHHNLIDNHVASGDLHYYQESVDHTRILSIGTNHHNLIDNHLASGEVHFFVDSIDHTSIQGIGTNHHNVIDNHLASGEVHFAEYTIDHGNITGLGDNDHAQYSLIDGTAAYTGTVSGVIPTDDAHLATKEYVDSLASSGGVSVHGLLTGLDSADHPQYSLINSVPTFSGVVLSGDNDGNSSAASAVLYGTATPPDASGTVDGTIYIQYASEGATTTLFKSISIEGPTASENITMMYLNNSRQVQEFDTVLQGTDPSITYTIRYATDRSLVGTEVVTGGSTVASTSGNIVTTFNNDVIPENSWMWLETTASGVHQSEFHLTIRYIEV